MTSSISESLSAMNLTSDTRRPRIQHNNKSNNTLLDETRGNVANARNESNVITREKSLLNVSIAEAVIGKYMIFVVVVVDILSHLASPSPHQSKRARQVLPANSTMDMTHIQDHYMECIRLSTENKINSKNAFLLKLNSLTSAETWTSEGETDFKMAGMAIDASAKIYAGRVDSVHQDTYSVLGSLGTRKDENESDTTAGGEEGKKEGNTEKKDKLKKKGKKKSVLTTAENLQRRDFEPQRLRNPILEKLAAASDVGGANGMLLFQLPMQERYFQFEIDFSQPYPAKYESPWLECQHEEGSDCVKDLFEMWDSIDHSPAPICTELEGFEFNDEGKFVKVSMEEEETNDIEPGTQSPIPFPSPQIDIPDGEDLFQSPDNSESEPDVAVPSPPPSPMTELSRILEAVEITEYSYLNADTLKELRKKEEKFNRASCKPSEGVQDKPAKKREFKKVQFIDFTSELDVTDFEYPKLSKTTQNTDQSVVAKAEQKNFYKTEDLSLPFDIRKLSSLFLIPSVCVKIKKESVQTESDELAGEDSYYNYDGDADTSAYIPFVNPDERIAPDNLSPTHRNISMVAAPVIPEKIVLNYDKRQRDIDMRALKGRMWNLINVPTSCEDLCSIEFSQVTESILTSTEEKANEPLTKALLFATLLHLANEHFLKLEQPDHCADIKIYQTQQS